jgi:RND superfamily putative drug exporter
VAGPSDGLGDQALEVVHELRDLPAPDGQEVLYTGTSARFIDDSAAVVDRLGLAAGLIAVTTFVLVFLFTGSVLLPIKALVMNVLALSAVLGVVTLVFQHGWLSGLLGFTPEPLDMSMPVLLFCIAFGLSMDYELFLIGRMHR